MAVQGGDRAGTVLGERGLGFHVLAAEAPVGILEGDPAGDCVYVNQRWCELSGLRPDEAVGRGWLRAVHPDDRARVADAWYAGSLRQVALDFRFRNDAGVVTWVSGRGAAVREREGAVAGRLLTVIDVTDRKRVERRVAAQHDATRVLAEAATLAEAAPRILSALCEALGWEWGALWTVDRAAGVVRCVDAWHPADVAFPAFESASRASTFEPGVGLPGRVWKSGEPAWIPDVVADGNLPRADVAVGEGLHDAVGVPLLLGASVLGVLEFFSREIREPDAALYGMLLSVGSQIGQFIQRREAEAEREAATARWEFLARASAVLASTLDYEETLAALARLVVPVLADWCSVDVVDGEGTVRRLALAQADPAKAHLARVAETYPPDPDGRHPRTRVLATGRSFLVTEVRDEELAQIADDPEHRRVLRALGYRSAMIVALAARGQTLGAITFATAESGRTYGPADLALAEELARRAAIAVDNARLYRDAQVANRTKDEFLATVSHELKTPLQAILGWAGVLRQGKLDAAGTARALGAIERAGRTQVRLVEELLDISRIVTGRLPLELRSTDLATAIDEVVDAARPTADAKGVRLATVLDRTIAPISADRVRLQQAVSNLLSNAIKFTPSGGRVEVGLARTDGGVAIVVTDTGQGIGRDFLPRIFEPSRQGTTTTNRTDGGLGLGLSIVRRMVELHGGRVEARSGGPGRGTEMVVVLPGPSSG